MGSKSARGMMVRIIFYSLLIAAMVSQSSGIRVVQEKEQVTKTAVFAMGSFWRAEAVYGCITGVVRTRVGYSGGSKLNPDYHSIGDHAECIEVEYDPKLISYERLLNVFWANHDPTQIFGQGPDVGPQYRSVIFTQGEEEVKLATASWDSEQLKLGKNEVVTEIQPLQAFYSAEAEHQKFELRQNSSLFQILGEITNDELIASTIATKLNGYAAGMCTSSVKKLLDTKVRPFLFNRSRLKEMFSS
ncbi:hypothetical protein BDL97_04G045400 [Sphagnum fallax]|jgi:peptide-methionine (S)-S-oxide reductase|nr:hypothetical protein BDL97_04G045400 [Sphagnum fallax]